MERSKEGTSLLVMAQEQRRVVVGWEKRPQMAILRMEVEAAKKPIPYLVAAAMVPVSV